MLTLNKEQTQHWSICDNNSIRNGMVRLLTEAIDDPKVANQREMIDRVFGIDKHKITPFWVLESNVDNRQFAPDTFTCSDLPVETVPFTARNSVSLISPS